MLHFFQVPSAGGADVFVGDVEVEEVCLRIAAARKLSDELCYSSQSSPSEEYSESSESSST
jgi:hypothetical protein